MRKQGIRQYLSKSLGGVLSLALCCTLLGTAPVTTLKAAGTETEIAPSAAELSADEVEQIRDAWKEEAILSPESGELAAAGPIQVTWKALKELPWEAASYEVYLDGELQGEVTVDGEQETFSYEVYTTKTAAHRVKIVAKLDSGKIVTSNIRTFFTSKKGLGIDNEQEAKAVPQDLALSWYYNWGTSPNANSMVKSSLEFVPMIWGAWNDFADGIAWLADEENQKYGTVLGFNEPDLESQSNVSVEKAVKYQKYFTESGLRIGSPAISGMPAWYDEGEGWFAEYAAAVNMDDIDFITFHTYPGYVAVSEDEKTTVEDSVTDYLNNLDKTYEMYQKPIWITEFAIANWGQNEYWHPFDGKDEAGNAAVLAFMKGVIEGLEERDYVERYAWQQFDMYDWAGGASCLYNQDTGELTDLGAAYRSLANPEGYVLPELDGTENAQTVKDEYVTDPSLTGEDAPAAPFGLKIADAGENQAELTWEASSTPDVTYTVYAAPSAFAEYTVLAEGIDDLSYTASYTTGANGTKWQYYKVAAKASDGTESELADEYVSLETELFGDNITFFAPTDKTEEIDRVLGETFAAANDYAADAQFQGEKNAFYYKPGDYTGTACVDLGFYTQIAGLGLTPYEVKLNNIEIPAYLDQDESRLDSELGYYDDTNSGNLGMATGTWANATCNFWRSAENLSVVGTGEASSYGDGVTANGSNWTKDQFTWAVAQAAPLRRVYSSRDTRFDWDWGWASGGFVADCLFEGQAGTDSGQQFYMRNSQVNGGLTYCTLNTVYQGVLNNALPTTDTTGWSALADGTGYTNWGTAGDGGAMQTVTTVNTTPIIREKPFLYLDAETNEYMVFVPDWQRDTSGVTWSEGNPGAGKSLSIDEFYIAKPGVTAAELNAQLAAGKNIFFTPGEYVVDEAIHVVQHDQIVLGTGMATIIPENSDTAMRVEDENGIIIAGLIFDAGTKDSETLLQVGKEGSSRNHQQNPTLLADLFFRIGGTTDQVTSAKTAVDINSNNVVCDHFWVWRADHGTGVAWNGNPATNGLVVDGDNVTAYGLFVEHFEEYDVLWRGEYGETYFYQNETAYDPISQDEYMSHDNSVKGYADYKVSNLVENHYAVGLGIYNVFIYTGPEGDSSIVSIQQENAIEVPNKENVLIENACIQTFARGEGAYQSINHIINGVGQGVSSGQTGEQKGEGWSRKFLLNYNNGTAKVGYTEPGTSTFTGTINTVTAAQPTNDSHVDDRTADEGGTMTPAIEDAVTVYPVIEIAEKTLSGNAITFTAQRRVPVCYTVNKHGIILATKPLSEEQFVLGAPGTKTGTAKTTGLLGTYSLKMSGVPKGATLYARAYLTYTDSDGNIDTIYSEIDSMTNQ